MCVMPGGLRREGLRCFCASTANKDEGPVVTGTGIVSGDIAKPMARHVA
jgi:hypothetical protein